MIHLAIRTEYSFGNCYAKISNIVKIPADVIGIADDNNVFGHAPFEKAMLKAGKKPIFGVRLEIFDNLTDRFSKRFQIILLAKNNSGLKEINKLTSKAWDQFFWQPRLTEHDFNSISNDVFIIGNISCDYAIRNFNNNFEIDPVYIDDNNYIEIKDRDIYQLIAGSTKRGEERNFNFNTELHHQHVLNENEVKAYFGQKCIDNTYKIAEQCNAYIKHAEMVKFKENTSIMELCINSEKNEVLIWEIDKYKKRFEYELNLIDKKGYTDYFLIVSDMIRYAKKNNILVGPSRGSSAGSLVCYLLDITEIDPIKHNLLFERFIDINRDDLPDIDIDFPDNKREQIIKYLIKKYGKENVCALANINKFKPKSAIGEFAQGLGISKYQTEAVKGAIILRSGADARSSNTIEDTFNETKAGKEFIRKYPAMKLTAEIEGHAHNAGKHAAGIIVSNKPLTNFSAINNRTGILMVDKRSAEYINLLKIDVLGLRTLSIIADVCKMIGMTHAEVYNLPLDNTKAYQLFQDMRLNGIFQFDGPALRNIVNQIGATEFNDLALITALSRPGALNSGGTGRYIEYKTGRSEPVYMSDVHRQITQESLGIVVYQEQMMQILRDIGNLPWENVNALRLAASHSMGDSYVAKYKDRFIEGATNNGETKINAIAYWNDIKNAGSWLFNKSHAVSYAVISYWTAYFKANYPIEFAASNLNHCPDDSAGIKLLRDFVENDSIKYIPIDADKSDINWTIKNGILVGGLINLPGIQEKTAKKILDDRNKGKITPSIFKKLSNPVTPYDNLFPCRTKFNNLYNSWNNEGLYKKPDYIRNVNTRGNYIIIGKIIQRDIRDRNDIQALERRDGRRIEGNSFFLRLVVEDDTDSIICMIGYRNFIRLNGKELSEKLVENETYVIINGAITGDWRTLSINKIEILE